MRTVMLAATMLVAMAGAVIAEPLGDVIVAHNKGDYPTAFRLLRPLAEEGDARAQFTLGFMYQNGRGVKIDNGQAIFWYQKAAEQGDDVASFSLGAICRHGVQYG
jgi:TPR repeat protein